MRLAKHMPEVSVTTGKLLVSAIYYMCEVCRTVTNLHYLHYLHSRVTAFVCLFLRSVIYYEYEYTWDTIPTDYGKVVILFSLGSCIIHTSEILTSLWLASCSSFFLDITGFHSIKLRSDGYSIPRGSFDISINFTEPTSAAVMGKFHSRQPGGNLKRGLILYDDLTSHAS